MKRERHPHCPLQSFSPAYRLDYTLLQHLSAMVLALAIHTVSTQVSAKARHSLMNPGVALPQEWHAICNTWPVLTMASIYSPRQHGRWEVNLHGSCSVQVPFSMISLMDHVRKKDLPPELKCRQVRHPGLVQSISAVVAKFPANLVLNHTCMPWNHTQCGHVFMQVFPTSGLRSTSLWCVPELTCDRSAPSTDPSIMLIQSQHL